MSFEHFTKQKTGFVTQIKDNASYRKIEDLDIKERIYNVVLQDKIIESDVKKKTKKY